MVLFYLLISAMPFMEHPLFGKWMGGLTVTKYLGGACLVFALVLVSQGKRIANPLARSNTRLFLGFILVSLASFVSLGSWGHVEVSPFALYISLLIQFFITPIFVDSPVKLRNVLVAELLAVAFASLYVIREWQLYHNLYKGFRPGAVVGDSNYFAVSVVACLPVSGYLLSATAGRWQRVVLAGCVVITLVALMLGASRGGLVGLTAATLFLVSQSKKRVRNLLAVGAVIVPLSLAVPTSPLRRLLNPGYSDNEAIRARQVAWKAGIRMIETHPLFGVGLGNFKPLSASYEDPGEIVISVAHNSYIEMAAELGIPGLLLFVGVQVTSFTGLSRFRLLARRIGYRFLERVAIGLQGSLVGSGVALCFVSGQIQKILWLNVFLAMCLPAILKRAAAKHTATARKRQLTSLACLAN